MAPCSSAQILEEQCEALETSSLDSSAREKTMEGKYPMVAELAVNLEEKIMQDKVSTVQINVLEKLLNDVFMELQPSETDIFARRDILNKLTNFIGHIDTCAGASVLPFGSFESNLYTPWGDLDISVILPYNSKPISRSRKVRVLKAMEKALLLGGGATRIQLRSEPRVPLLMFEDAYWRISCDVSVDNTIAVLKSRVFGWVTGIDPRCRQLIFLIKSWAKAQCINDPKMGTLNSYAISLLVIFHLQTRDPPILPPLNTLITEGMLWETEGYALKQCLSKVQCLTKESFGRKNTSSVAELFLSFFTQFSAVEELWVQGLSACTSTGRWGDRNSTESSWDSKGYLMLVEDPFDHSDNCARSVHENSFKLISNAFKLTLETLYNKSLYWFPSKVRERIFCWPVGTPRPLYRIHQPGIPQLEAFVPKMFQRLELVVKKKKGRQHKQVLTEQLSVTKPKAVTNQVLTEQLTDNTTEQSRVQDTALTEELTDKTEKLTESVRTLERKRRAAMRRQEREERLKDPELDILLCVRRLFYLPKRRRRRRRRGDKPKRSTEHTTNPADQYNCYRTVNFPINSA